MVARQGHREFVPLVVGKSVSECRNVVVPVMAVVNAKLILLTTALNLKKSTVQKSKSLLIKFSQKSLFLGVGVGGWECYWVEVGLEILLRIQSER